jgi:hypothetical protein
MENTLAYNSRTLITDTKGVIAQALGGLYYKTFHGRNLRVLEVS